MINLNNWNGNNFPYRLFIEYDNKWNCKKLVLEKYLLDNLEGDIDLDQAPSSRLLEVFGSSEEDCLKRGELYIPKEMML